MFDEIRLLLAPHYLWIKAIHVLAAMIWAGSTAVAYAYYLKPAFRRVQQRPGDAAARAERNRLMERFDLGRASYVTVKLWVGALVFLPMEIVDVYLSHLGGNKAAIRASGDTARYERFMDLHWLFFRVTEPIIVIVVPIVVLLAVAKPF